MVFFELIFESLRNFSDSSRKQIFLFYFEIVCCVYSLELPHQGNSNEYMQHTIFFVEDRKHLHKLLPFASWSGAMIKSHWLELPISRTNFYGPKDVWAIEVWLYIFFISTWKNMSWYS